MISFTFNQVEEIEGDKYGSDTNIHWPKSHY